MTQCKKVLSVLTFRLDIIERCIRLLQLTIRMESKYVLISAIFIPNTKQLLATDESNNSAENMNVRVVF